MRKVMRRGWSAWWVRFYTLRLLAYQTAAQERAAKLAEMDTLSAKLAAPTPSVCVVNTTIVPTGFFVTRAPAKVARGAVKRKGSAIMGGTSPRWSASTPASNVIRTVALKGW